MPTEDGTYNRKTNTQGERPMVEVHKGITKELGIKIPQRTQGKVPQKT
jgi:hypothetical protein